MSRGLGTFKSKFHYKVAVLNDDQTQFGRRTKCQGI